MKEEQNYISLSVVLLLHVALLSKTIKAVGAKREEVKPIARLKSDIQKWTKKEAAAVSVFLNDEDSAKILQGQSMGLMHTLKQRSNDGPAEALFDNIEVIHSIFMRMILNPACIADIFDTINGNASNLTKTEFDLWLKKIREYDTTLKACHNCLKLSNPPQEMKAKTIQALELVISDWKELNDKDEGND